MRLGGDSPYRRHRPGCREAVLRTRRPDDLRPRPERQHGKPDRDKHNHDKQQPSKNGRGRLFSRERAGGATAAPFPIAICRRTHPRTLGMAGSRSSQPTA